MRDLSSALIRPTDLPIMEVRSPHRPERLVADERFLIRPHPLGCSSAGDHHGRRSAAKPTGVHNAHLPDRAASGAAAIASDRGRHETDRRPRPEPDRYGRSRSGPASGAAALDFVPCPLLPMEKHGQQKRIGSRMLPRQNSDTAPFFFDDASGIARQRS